MYCIDTKLFPDYVSTNSEISNELIESHFLTKSLKQNVASTYSSMTPHVPEICCPTICGF